MVFFILGGIPQGQQVGLFYSWGAYLRGSWLVYFILGGHTSGAAGWFILSLGGVPQEQQVGLFYSFRAYLRGSRLVYFILGGGDIPQGQHVGLFYSCRAYLRGSMLVYFILVGHTSGAAGWYVLN